MSISPFNLDPIVLAAHVAKAYNSTHQLAYAHLSPTLKVLQTSPNFLSLLHTPGIEVIGQPIANVLWEFVGADDILKDVLHGIQPDYQLDQVHREQADGSLSYLSFRVSAVREQDPSSGLLLLIEDTTEHGRLQQDLVQDRNELRLLQKKLEQANIDLVELNQLKSLFLSMAAHDLQTPLTAIFGYADLLLAGVADGSKEQQQDFLETIRAQANRLSRLVTDFLDLDQIEQGTLNIIPMECLLNELITEVSAVVSVEAQQREISLELDLPEEPLLLWADPDKLQQVLYNLTGNALKYTMSGGSIRIEASQTPDSVTFSIADSGLGMSEAQLANLFTLYYRTEEATELRIKGKGLGLYIVKSLVEAHNGRVHVTSEPNRGTTFTVVLPKGTDF
ncbi:MAG: sensor histidine kinase [Chloroflexi bacterium]|nr:MAG: sensor histidine kinase [Chloroflexota bacterium]